MFMKRDTRDTISQPGWHVGLSHHISQASLGHFHPKTLVEAEMPILEEITSKKIFLNPQRMSYRG
jgi:hypothetical protein